MASSSVRLTQILGHAGGGWDEMLLGASPIVVIIGVLALVKRRGDRSTGDATADYDEPDRSRDGH